MDVAAIGSLFGSLKAATDIAKLIRESGITLERAELKLKLAELMEALADAKIGAAEVQQLILERDAEIRTLREEARVRRDLRWEPPCYFLPDATQSRQEQAYCQKCYDGDSRLVRLHTDGKGLYSCVVCKQTYKTQERQASDDAKVRAARQYRSDSPFPRNW
ncbi:MAG TPA: hypothetical protein PLJ16_07915 [Casimicrobium huifangae]|jgi:hypothetical protein|uniref:hypothetical protein n=1 Tax=Casimicrobium huifangae TaxID=2591109 RepID=UPI0012EBBE7E|nr:hypothetical protein [Casimicrobium huifangae]HOB02631.1 hypothetical protein [Casimicrobium huifangae]HQA34641.1 hypothetical protein [Casimicrobium huifangae]HQD65138.1 hypothetical protein [Casimicrobium huifangae]